MSTIITALLFASSTLAGQIFPEDRTYHHHLFRTAQACKEAQDKNFWVNCTQTISLNKDGSASVMFTDIMNSASYEIIGNRIVVKSTSPGDMPEKMELLVDATGRNLISPEHPEIVWELEQACE